METEIKSKIIESDHPQSSTESDLFKDDKDSEIMIAEDSVQRSSSITLLQDAQEPARTVILGSTAQPQYVWTTPTITPKLTSKRRYKCQLVPKDDLPSDVRESIPESVEEELLDQKLASLTSEFSKFKEDARRIIIDYRTELTKLEKEENAKDVAHKTKYLGKFKQFREGYKYVDRWCDGLKKQEKLNEMKEENEKKRKIWNEKKNLNSILAIELQDRQITLKCEDYECKKLKHDKKENKLNAKIEKLNRKRNCHIREVKRLNNEASSKVKAFTILNNRYLITNLLGKSDFAEVHKAFDLENLCYVACKIHDVTSYRDETKKDNYIKHALREIAIHKTLEHEHIIKVQEVFDIDINSFCTVLDYCENIDLEFYLKQKRYLPEREAKCIINKVLEALLYLNDRMNPIIHYNLKPANILINNDDIKVTDFGLSKIFTSNNVHSDVMELTSQGAGTYWYLPPECFVIDNGPPMISNKVDVWSVGVIFYQMLLGKKPFYNDMTQEYIHKNNVILDAKSITFPLEPKVSEGAKSFIRSCCTYDKAFRPDIFQVLNDDYLKKDETKTRLS